MYHAEDETPARTEALRHAPENRVNICDVMKDHPSSHNVNVIWQSEVFDITHYKASVSVAKPRRCDIDHPR